MGETGHIKTNTIVTDKVPRTTALILFSELDTGLVEMPCKFVSIPQQVDEHIAHENGVTADNHIGGNFPGYIFPLRKHFIDDLLCHLAQAYIAIIKYSPGNP